MGRSRRNALRESRVMVLEALFAGEYSEPPLMSPGAPFPAKDDLDQESREFRDRLWLLVLENRSAIDAVIAETASGWTIERMAKVERNILRIATCEILYDPGVPFRVSVDEALELAHQYCEPGAVSFINGILHKIGMEHNLSKVEAPIPDREEQGS